MLYCRLAIMDDLAPWGLCGIPSIWRSPTTRCPGATFFPSTSPTCQACPRGTAWVALGEVDGMPHPLPDPLPG